MYHFRSNIGAEERYLAETNRAWRSLLLCVASGATALACVLCLPPPPMGNPAGTNLTAITLWEQESESAPGAVPPPLKLHPQPPTDVALPTVAAELPTLEAADIPPPPLQEEVMQTEERGEESVLFPSPATLGESHHPRTGHKAALAASSRPLQSHPHPQPLGGFTPPSYREAPEPPYPPALRAERAEGTVKVRITVDAYGKPTQVDITQSSGQREFDTTAREWILNHWHFNPAHQGKTPTAGVVSTSIRFVIQ